MEELRTIKINKDQAIKWYNSGNDTLRQLSLSAFGKNELERLSFDTIESRMTSQESQRINKIQELQYRLYVLAQYFNDADYDRCASEGYFVQYIADAYFGEKPYRISKHSNKTIQAGVVYFQRESDLEEVLTYFTKDEVKTLLLGKC